MKKQFCESVRYVHSSMMLQSHYSWHLTWTGPYRDSQKSVQSLSIVDPRHGPQFLRQILSDLTL